MSVADRKAVLEARLILIQNAITNALTNGHASSYSTEIQGVSYRSLKELQKAEQAIRNELTRLNRGTRFGGIGFKRVAD